MKHARLFALGSVVLLHACGDAGTDQVRQPIKAGSPYVDKLKALTPLNRGLALRRAILDSGERCKKVDASGYQQDYKNLSMWIVRCSDSGGWAVFIAPNADVQVRACAETAQLKLPACGAETRP